MSRIGRSARRALTVVIAGGGTGGHLYPGIAVARELLRRVPEATVTFAGTAKGLESRVVPPAGFALDLIRSAGLKGKSWSARLRGAALLVPGVVDSWRLLSARRPAVVIGVGGYSSGPVVLLAALRGIPTMVLEQNALPGLTNRLLSHVVSAAAVTYEETLPFFRGRGFVTGNPVRSEFFATPSSPAGLSAGRRRLLILGGSQGAHAINVAMVEASAELVRRNPDLQVVHQTGHRDLEYVRREYATRDIGARAEPFLDPVADEVKAADLVLCRAGATTIAELAAAGRPAVLVPLAAATDDHQRRNARALEQVGGALVIDERELGGERVVEVVTRVLADADALARMGRAMRSLARPDAAERIVERVIALGGHGSQATEPGGH